MTDRTLRALFFVLLLMPLLAACGDDDVAVTTTNGGGSGGDSGSGSSAGGSTAKIGLFDASPMRGSEVRGQVTYVFRKPPEGAKPKVGGSVSFGILQDIDSFNPFLSSSATASEVHDLIFPRLMVEQPDYYDGVPTFTPEIAESWTVAPDNLSIRFKLREATWSDGTPITSHDVRFSWEAGRDPQVAWVSASIVDFIKDVECHNDRELTVHYTKPSPYNIMDINDVQMVPRHTFGTVPFAKWRGHDDWVGIATSACGGPWLLANHDPGQTISFKPNPRYWDAPKPHLERLTMRIFGSQEPMLNALLAGELDIMDSVTPEKTSRVLEKDHLYLYTCVARSYGYMGFNCKRFPFDDKRVRQAITYGTNRRDIVESIFSGYAKIAGPNVITSLWASKRELKPYPFDPDKAAALLKEAGWTKNADGWLEKDGKVFRYKLQTNQGNVVRKQICEYVQADLKRLGIDARIQITDFNQMSTQLKKHNFDSYVGGWYIATKVDYKPTFHSVSINGRYNYVNFVNDEVDALIDKGRIMNINDPAIMAEAKQVWGRMQDILYDEQPYCMIYEPRKLTGVNKKFTNVRITALRALSNIHEWWIE